MTKMSNSSSSDFYEETVQEDEVEISWREDVLEEEFLSENDIHVYPPMRLLKSDSEEIVARKLRYRELCDKIKQSIRNDDDTCQLHFQELPSLFPERVFENWFPENPCTNLKQDYILNYLMAFSEVALEVENLCVIEFLLRNVDVPCYGMLWRSIFISAAKRQQHDILAPILQNAEKRYFFLQPRIKRSMLEIEDEKVIKLLLLSELELDFEIGGDMEYDEATKVAVKEMLELIIEFPECVPLFLQKLKTRDVELYELGLLLLQEDV